MLFICRFFLSFIAFCFVTFAANTTSNLKHRTPLRHTYTHELLREARTQPHTLHRGYGILKQLKIGSQRSLVPFILNAYCPLASFVLLDMGVDGKCAEEIISIFNSDIEMQEKSLKTRLINNIRGNLIIAKKRYKYPAYFRFGYDYIPFGYHASEVNSPHDMITRDMLQQKNFVAEIGLGSYLRPYYQLQGSLAHAISSKVTLLNIQYVRDKGNFWTTKRYIAGGGVGISNTKKVLFNFYNHIDFSNAYHFRVEYLKNTLFDNSGYDACNALHVEGAKHFATPQQWYIPYVFALGYERGCEGIKEPVFFKERRENLFGVFKFALFEKRIVLLAGVQRNFIEDELEFVYGLGVSL